MVDPTWRTTRRVGTSLRVITRIGYVGTPVPLAAAPVRTLDTLAAGATCPRGLSTGWGRR